MIAGGVDARVPELELRKADLVLLLNQSAVIAADDSVPDEARACCPAWGRAWRCNCNGCVGTRRGVPIHGREDTVIESRNEICAIGVDRGIDQLKQRNADGVVQRNLLTVIAALSLIISPTL